MPALRKTKDQIREAEIKKLFTLGLIEKGWTQKHLAKLVGKDPGNISKAINHPLKREFGFMLMLADKVGVNLGDALKESK